MQGNVKEVLINTLVVEHPPGLAGRAMVTKLNEFNLSDTLVAKIGLPHSLAELVKMIPKTYTDTNASLRTGVLEPNTGNIAWGSLSHPHNHHI